MPVIFDCLLRRMESVLYGVILVLAAAVGDDDASDHDPLASPLGTSAARSWRPPDPARLQPAS